MPVIRISEPTFQRLQALATPLVDTPSTVVERLLDLYDDVKAAGKHLAGGTHAQPPNPPKRELGLSHIPQLDPEDAPDFTHARIVSGNFGGRLVRNWNELVHVAHRVAFAQLRTLEKVKAASKSNILPGHFRSGGFHFLKELNISIQNVSANDAWRRALHLARQLRVPIEIEVAWEHKKGAVLPGQQRTIRWPRTPKDSNSTEV